MTFVGKPVFFSIVISEVDVGNTFLYLRIYLYRVQSPCTQMRCVQGDLGKRLQRLWGIPMIDLPAPAQVVVGGHVFDMLPTTGQCGPAMMNDNACTAIFSKRSRILHQTGLINGPSRHVSKRAMHRQNR